MRSLENIRILDLSRALAGPFCTMTLGDLGADVIKVEEPDVGDDSRHWGPPFKNGESAYFLSCNRNKRGVVLNLKQEAGKIALWRLIETSDVLVENFRPGLIDALGFDFETIAARNPRLIYCSISGYGQDGPESHLPGYDIILQGTSGVDSLTGEPDGTPIRCGLPICDILAGMSAAQGILAALYVRQQTGRGQRVATTLFGATVAALGNFATSYLLSGELPTRVGNSHPQIAPYDLVHTADGYINIACGNDDVWRRLCAVLRLDGLLSDPRFASNSARVRYRPEVLSAIEERTTQLSTKDALALLNDARVPAGPIHDLAQVFASQQAQHMELAQAMQHPTVGVFRSVNSPLYLSETPTSLRLPPPTLGQHTADVLHEVGFSDEEIAEWRRDGTI